MTHLYERTVLDDCVRNGDRRYYDHCMRELFIVARHETELYEYLVNHFREDSSVEVILDRRNKGDRRAGINRRRARLDDDLGQLGFAVVRTA